jgi:hypothetical protein
MTAVVRIVPPAFSGLINIPWHGHLAFIHLFICLEPLDRACLLAVGSSAAVDICKCRYLFEHEHLFSVLWGVYLRVGLLAPWSNSMLNFLGSPPQTVMG